MATTREILERARAASAELLLLGSEEKNQILLAMADALEASTEEILAANREDLAAAEGSISPVMQDRLRLDANRIRGMAEGIREVVALPDPVGKILDTVTFKNC